MTQFIINLSTEPEQTSHNQKVSVIQQQFILFT